MDVERLELGDFKIEITSFETGELIKEKRIFVEGDF